MIIRDAGTQDADPIARIWNAYIRETAATFTTVEKASDQIAQKIQERQAQGWAFLVAEQADQVVGFASYFQFRGGPGYAHTAEHSIMLWPAYCGQGTGPKLMQALENHARKAGMHVLIAGISGENSGAIRFHEGLGFTQVARLPEAGRKFGRWMDLILMQKFL